MVTTPPGTGNQYRFIAHDVDPKIKQQNINYIRAHVKRRYYQEHKQYHHLKQPQTTYHGTDQKVQPVGRGQIIRWGDDIEKSKRARKCVIKTSAKTTKKENLSKEGEIIDTLDCSTPVATSKSTPLSKTVSRAEGDPVSKEFLQRLSVSREIKSLMPDNEFERGGQRLIQVLGGYYGSLEINQQCTSPRHEFWLPFAFSDPLVFHACLSKSIAHAAADCGGVLSRPDILKHTGLAIQLLTKAIAQKNLLPSNELIIATFSLIGAEMLNPDRTVMRTHLKAAREMIAMRGGALTMKDVPMLMAGYFAYEYMIATIDEDLQDIAAINICDVPNPYFIVLPAATGVFTLVRTPIDPGAYGYSQDTVELLLALRDHLSVSDIFFRQTEARYGGSIPFAKMVRDLSLKYESNAHSLPGYLPDHVLYALLITTSLQFPELAASSSLARLAHVEKLRRLQYHIKRSPKHNYWTPIPGALIWCLMVGVSAAKGLPLREFFIANMIRTTAGVAFELIEPVRFALATFYRLRQQQKTISEEGYRYLR